MFKVLRKADIILFILLLLAAVAGFVLFALRTDASPGEVVITVDGELYGTYSLAADRIIEIEQGEKKNEVVIENSTVRMEYSTCHNQICVNQGLIDSTGQSIICLPNKVVVSISGGKEGNVDVIAQ